MSNARLIPTEKVRSVKSQNTHDVSIDILKGMAIIAVVSEHTQGFFTSLTPLSMDVTLFCVSVFIILAGYNSYNSYVNKIEKNRLKHQFYDTSDLRKYLTPLLFSYSICVGVVQVVETHFFDFGAYWERLINFGNGSPFYYLAIFFSLILIRQPFCVLILKMDRHLSTVNKILLFTVVLIICAILSFAFLKYTFIPFNKTLWPHNYLFGGTYFFLFVFGIIVSCLVKDVQNMSLTRSVGGGVFVLSLALYWFNRPLNSSDLFKQNNPPGLIVCLYAIGVFLLIIKLPFGSKRSNTNAKFVMKLKPIFAKVASPFGKYSWSIYLYHYVIILIITKIIQHYDFRWTYNLSGIAKYFVWITLFLLIPSLCVFSKMIQVKIKRAAMSLQ